jgi:hypothetical protein
MKIRTNLLSNPLWHAKAACRKYSDNYWLMNNVNGTNHRKAKIICNTECPVRAECLAWILEIERKNGGQFGVYGGLSEKERKPLRLCYYKYCDKVQMHRSKFCSPEHQKLQIREFHKNYNQNPPSNYYMQGHLHGYRAAD